VVRSSQNVDTAGLASWNLDFKAGPQGGTTIEVGRRGGGGNSGSLGLIPSLGPLGEEKRGWEKIGIRENVRGCMEEVD